VGNPKLASGKVTSYLEEGWLIISVKHNETKAAARSRVSKLQRISQAAHRSRSEQNTE
jgi:hypothetical protein